MATKATIDNQFSERLSDALLRRKETRLKAVFLISLGNQPPEKGRMNPA